MFWFISQDIKKLTFTLSHIIFVFIYFQNFKVQVHFNDFIKTFIRKKLRTLNCCDNKNIPN